LFSKFTFVDIPVPVTNCAFCRSENLYRTWLQERQAKSATINRQLAAIRAYAKWYQESGKISADPMRGVRPVATQKLAPKWLDRGQQHALISTAEKALNAAKTEAAKMVVQRDLTIVKTLLATGLRIGELCDLTISDVIISPRKGKIIDRQGKESCSVKCRLTPKHVKRSPTGSNYVARMAACCFQENAVKGFRIAGFIAGRRSWAGSRRWKSTRILCVTLFPGI
jgi:integrase